MANFVDIELIVEAELGAASDPLLCNVEMPLCATYYPLGFPVEIATNSSYILEAAEESWGEFRTAAFSVPPFQLRVGVTETESNRCPPYPVCRSHRNLLSVVADADNFSTCDLERRFAFIWLSQTAAEHRSYVRYHFLESAFFVLLASSYATPIHAACVSYEGRGFLLCGDSGAGKSSLAYACACAGWAYTTDDSSYLLRGREDNLVVGNAYKIRFRPSAVQLFPELGGRTLTPRAVGKPSIEIPVGRVADIATVSQCSIDHVVFLNRQSGDQATVEPFPAEAAMQWLNPTPYGNSDTRDSQTESLRKLLKADIWELRYSDLNDAIEVLQSLARRSK